MPPIETGERLRRFMTAIAPTERELALADRRVTAIRKRLEKDFDVKRVLAVGSHWKGTAVRRHSDLDLFAIFTRDEARKWAGSEAKSSTLIGRVRRSLSSRYPGTTPRIDKQAVVVPFERAQHRIDVVPAVFDCFLDAPRVPLYLIPDGAGGWLRTAPQLHKQYVDDAHARSGHKLKSLVRMLKWWSASRAATSPISSLYLEWFVIWADVPLGFTYQRSLVHVFDAMIDSGVPPLPDPDEISDTPVLPVRTRTQRLALLRMLAQSLRRAENAVSAEARRNHRLAIDQWSLVFNRSFPLSPG